ncbi:sigma-70 family RNA polymerase sigma factor [Flavivirga amylovorans]|uniref:Sigma-70 family RNA polymerase sigma factor n=1 Tax=Flavivirga amylovorans TaxID=870486 RepID=A0ABT8X2N3_9FLAO|nr:sigma-70 family RNA polymerase sigma factor [Flavivirga amylovorans]MDO5988175.1 sigma-70 family RNA polymerase sigma factor [Flavivirga amylovorans]
MNIIKKEKEISKIYNEVYNSLYASLCFFSNKYTNNLEKSKGIVQEVYIRLWNHDILSQGNDAIKAFLYISVRNKSLDYLKSKECQMKNNSTSLDIQMIASDTYFEKEVLIEEISRLVNEAIKTLPLKCREVVELSMRGHQNSHISEELGISINTVKMQKRIAYKKLRPLLKDCYVFVLALLTV